MTTSFPFFPTPSVIKKRDFTRSLFPGILVPAMRHLFDLLDRVFGQGWARKKEEQLWYSVVTWGLRRDRVYFLNFGYEENPPMGIPLGEAEEADRASIQLYHQVASQVELRRKTVLEVSCGHGGGAAYLMRSFQPRRYTALDLNPAGVRFCQRHHHVEGLDFVRGDAEALQFSSGSFDVVINIDASHCFPNFPRFLTEVARVLRPGGFLLYVDKRGGDQVAEWERALLDSPFTICSLRHINAEVARGMERNSTRSQNLIASRLPKILHSLGQEWAGVHGSRTHDAVINGHASYRSYCLQKVA
jgi:SAM-dependent methyltransferase